jgi:hypothetical protein
MHFSLKDGWIEKPMAPSESAPQDISNEWSCRYVLTILNFLSNFCILPLVTEVAISPYMISKQSSHIMEMESR